MASSGTYGFDPKVAELVDEAFERCLIDPAAITARHAKTARRSFNLLAADWSNRGRREWKASTDSHTVTADEVSFTLAASVLDISDVTLSRSSKETPIGRITRDQYRSIYDKTITGRPAVYFLDRQITPVVYYWFAAENSTDIIKYTKHVRIQDVLTAAETFDVPYRWLEAVTSGIAAKLAQKFARDLYPDLLAEAETRFRQAHGEDNDGGDLIIGYVY